MKITIIGCRGAYPEQNQATSGYLIETSKTKVLLDCGSGVLSKVQKYILLENLDGVIFSHYHFDHCADLGCLQYATMILMQLGNRLKPLVLYGPGKEEQLTYGEYCIGKSYLHTKHFQIGDLIFTNQKNVHDVPSYALRVEDFYRNSIVYSGDTGFYTELAKIAQNADLFLCESSLYQEQKGKIEGHLCSTEAGKLAEQAQVKQLCLTHFPHYGKIEQLLNEAKQEYTGKIVCAEEDLVFQFEIKEE